MVQLSAYVQTASNGDEAIIISSGMQVAKRKASPEVMSTPANLVCLHTDKSTEVPLRWKPVVKQRWYAVEFTQTPDDPDSWKAAGSCSKASYTVTGLKAAEQYWFRVAAGGPLGVSAWSDPAKRILG